MSRKNDRAHDQQFDRARDELFSHIHRCEVLRAAEEHQREWMGDTIEYLGERYPSLGADDLEELRQIGMRFCRPVIRNVDESAESQPQDAARTAATEAAAA